MYTSAQNAQQLLQAIETDSVNVEQVKNCFLGFPYKSFKQGDDGNTEPIPIPGKIDRPVTTLQNANGRWESWLDNELMYPAGSSP